MRRQAGFTLAEVMVALALVAVLAAGCGRVLAAAARVTARLQETRRLELLADLLLDQIEAEVAGCRPAGDGTAAQSLAVGPAGESVAFLDADGCPVTIALAEGSLVCTRTLPGAEPAARRWSEELDPNSRVTALAFTPAEGRAGHAQLVRVALTVEGAGGTACSAVRLVACYDLGRAVPWAE